MRLKKLAFAVSVAFLAVSGFAQAANSSATLTADNEFWLYSGNASGSNLQLITHGNNWGTAYSANFDVAAGDYLYLMALDWGQPHAWQGKFSTPLGALFTNANSWVAFNTTSTTVNSAVISSATWGGIGTELAANSGPWGMVVGDANAKWIWSTGIYSANTTVLFRTANVVAAVPEPESYALMLAGLGLLGFASRRKNNLGA